MDVWGAAGSRNGQFHDARIQLLAGVSTAGNRSGLPQSASRGTFTTQSGFGVGVEHHQTPRSGSQDLELGPVFDLIICCCCPSIQHVPPAIFISNEDADLARALLKKVSPCSALTKEFSRDWLELFTRGDRQLPASMRQSAPAPPLADPPGTLATAKIVSRLLGALGRVGLL